MDGESRTVQKETLPIGRHVVLRRGAAVGPGELVEPRLQQQQRALPRHRLRRLQRRRPHRGPRARRGPADGARLGLEFESLGNSSKLTRSSPVDGGGRVPHEGLRLESHLVDLLRLLRRHGLFCCGMTRLSFKSDNRSTYISDTFLIRTRSRLYLFTRNFRPDISIPLGPTVRIKA